MPSCKQCDKTCGFLELKGGLCPSCQRKESKSQSSELAKTLYKSAMQALKSGNEDFAHSEMQTIINNHRDTEEADLVRAYYSEIKAKKIADNERKLKLVMTTETVPTFEISERLGIIGAECVYGMNVFRDIFASVRDVVGGRSASTQNVLRDARAQVLEELRGEAFKLGADAVVGVDLDYSEFSGGGKSMLLVVATGTAVKIKDAK